MLRATSPELCTQLEELLAARKDITKVLWQNRDLLKALQNENARSCAPEDILRLSRNLTYTSFAPKGWVPGAPLFGGHPPAPQVEQMRGGLLGALGVSRGITTSSAQAVPVPGLNVEGLSSSSSILLEETADLKGDAMEQVVENIENYEETGASAASFPENKQEELQHDSPEVKIPTVMHTDRFSKNQGGPNSGTAVKKTRVIDMNYGFSSDSSDDSSEED